ncbi:putative methyltransferase DDB_G0268948 [Amphiura filiformis]|uniref:putative methyltransferase DDB_G0268948 n=1 Tax=Amphiura filiformis TaxID=82378 RepID=UPI003B20D433
MNAATRKQFAEAEHATVYTKYRPKADPKVLETVIKYLKEKKQTPLNVAVDVACGSGQSTVGLAPYFKKVIGYDISAAQINEGRRVNTLRNIEYATADAENIPLPDKSVDLVTCSQAVHWFNFDAFFREVDRILTPNGVLAVYSRGDYVLVHEDADVAKELTKIYKDCTWKTLAAYWNDPVHATRQNGYVDLAIPYPDFERVTMESQMDLTLTSLTGFISSFTAYQRFHRENPNDDIITPLHTRFLQALNVQTLPEETTVTTSCPIFMMIGRKPGTI